MYVERRRGFIFNFQPVSMHYFKAAKKVTSVLGGHIEISFNCSGNLRIVKINK